MLSLSKSSSVFEKGENDESYLCYSRHAGRYSSNRCDFDQAKTFLKASGSPQWQAGYPNTDTVAQDLANQSAWVLKVNGQVAGYAAAIIGDDPNYQEIDGAWQNNTEPYAAIHRLALSQDYRGQHLAKYFMSSLISILNEQGIHNFRVDTHDLNQPMQHVATSNGFIRRGHINILDEPMIHYVGRLNLNL
mgnify:CR=1 FL=1